MAATSECDYVITNDALLAMDKYTDQYRKDLMDAALQNAIHAGRLTASGVTRICLEDVEVICQY